MVNLGDVTTREILQGTALANLGSLTVDGGALRNYATLCHNSGELTVRTGGTLNNNGWLHVSASLSAEAGGTLAHDGLVLYKESVNPGAMDGKGRVIAIDHINDDRTCYVGGESELREALNGGRFDLVIWKGYDSRFKINIDGGELIITKGLILGCSEAFPADLNSGGITVTGENGFLVTGVVDYHGNGLMVEQGGTSTMDAGIIRNLGRVDVSSGGLVLLNGNLPMENGEIRVSDGGWLIETNGVITLEWEDAPLRVSGRLEKKGRIRAAEGACVEMVDGGVFTGNQAEPLE